MVEQKFICSQKQRVQQLAQEQGQKGKNRGHTQQLTFKMFPDLPEYTLSLCPGLPKNSAQILLKHLVRQ